LFALLLIIPCGTGRGTLFQRASFKHEQAKDALSPFTQWQGRKLRGTTATLVGLAVASAFYPFAYHPGITFGLEAKQWIMTVLIVVGLVVILGWIKCRGGGNE